MAIYGVSIVMSQEEINPVITGRHRFTFTQINWCIHDVGDKKVPLIIYFMVKHHLYILILCLFNLIVYLKLLYCIKSHNNYCSLTLNLESHPILYFY